MSKIYVVLRDKGTIFHDGTQDVSVTGLLPTEVKPTAKITKAIQDGILIKVDEKEAEALIAKDAGKTKASAKADNDLRDKIAELEASNKTLTTQAEEAATKLKAVEGERDEFKTKVEEVASINVQLSADLNTAVNDLAAKNEAYDTLKASIKEDPKDTKK